MRPEDKVGAWRLLMTPAAAVSTPRGSGEARWVGQRVARQVEWGGATEKRVVGSGAVVCGGGSAR